MQKLKDMIVCMYDLIIHESVYYCYTLPQAPRLSAQYAFVSFLGSICRKMIKHTTRELRSE